MKKVNIYCNKQEKVGEIDKRIFGSFIEHLGRAVYTGIYEPTHPLANKDGFRQDVIDAVKELNISLLRYPGGNFVSGYNWKDGIGKNRPVRLNLAWQSIETNEFGIHEFSKWCETTGIEPMMAINMGSDTNLSAAEEVEYCNHKEGTYLSDLRRKNGSEKPFNFKIWCLGNEMDGDWQIGHITAEEYGMRARDFAKIMRTANGERWDTKQKHKLELVVAGSSIKELPTFNVWDKTVLENTYDVIDYISLHRYYAYNKNGQNPIIDFLGTPTDLSNMIETISKTIKEVKAEKNEIKDVFISFDEWNIWDGSIPRTDELWGKNQKILEQRYTFLDSIVFAGYLNTFINHCDVVKIACMAQLVNAIAPIITNENGGLFKQTIFYPFALASNNVSGVCLRSKNDSDVLDSWYCKSNEVNQSISYDEKTGAITCIVCNYSEQDSEIVINLDGFNKLNVLFAKEMHNDNLFIVNDFNCENNVIPTSLQVELKNEKLFIHAKPYSYNIIKISEQ